MSVQRQDPYSSFNFRVDLGDGNSAGFSEVSGLTQEIAVIRYREGSDKGNSERLLPGLAKGGEVTLKRGLTGALDLVQWMRAMQQGDPGQRRTVTIQLLTEDRSGPVVTWRLLQAFPSKLTHGPLAAAESRVVIEELVLACSAIEVE